MPICNTCDHECHCDNGGECCGGNCECKSCKHPIAYEPNNA